MLTERGIQSWYARRINASRSVINAIFNGRRRPTPEQAAKLEALFIQKGVPLNRWDLLYGNPEGLPLSQFIDQVQEKEKAMRKKPEPQSAEGMF